jgi:hypothetical protein
MIVKVATAPVFPTMFIVVVPESVGVPESCPVEVLKDSPAGSGVRESRVYEVTAGDEVYVSKLEPRATLAGTLSVVGFTERVGLAGV